MRPLLAIAACALVLSACGGDPAPEPAPGTPQNPLAAVPEKGGTAAPRVRGSEGAPKTAAPGGARKRAETSGADRLTPPGYEDLVKKQASKPRSTFTPCNLVPEARAAAIVGAPMQAPLEAPQGPSCIYRTRKGGTFVSLSVQPLTLRALRPQLKRARAVEVGGRRAYCAGPSLFLPVGGTRVLSVSAPCRLATRFAAEAARRL